MNSESIFCLGEDVAKHSHTLLIARPAIEKFVLGTKYVESLDGLLERLDTLAFHINDLSKSFGLNSVNVFKLILSCNEVKEVLRPFAIYVNEIQNKVIADPRHKTLKPYLDLLLELLKNLEPLERIAEKRHRLTPWVFEKEPVVREEVQNITKESSSDKYKPDTNRRVKEIPVKIVKARSRSSVLRKATIAILIAVLTFFGVTLYMYDKLLSEPKSDRHSDIQLTSLPITLTQFTTNWASGRKTDITTHDHSGSYHTEIKATEHSTAYAPTTRYITTPYTFTTTTIPLTHTQPSTYTVKVNSPVGSVSISSPLPTSTHRILRQELVFGNTLLVVNGSHLIVKYHGRWLPYLWLSTNRTIHLIPYPALGDDNVVADYVFVNSTYSIAKFSLNKLYRLLGDVIYISPIEVGINSPDASMKCYLVFNGSAFGFTDCRSVLFITLSIFNTMSIHKAILRYVNTTAIDYLSQNLLGGVRNWNPVSLSWYILDWLDKNSKYDYAKATTTLFSPISDPITFFNVKSGICSDYALFTVAALLAGGVDEAYVLVFDTKQGSHATAAIKIGGVLYVLDQRLPIYEWADYIEYVFAPAGKEMQIVKVWLDSNGLSAVEAITVDPLQFTSKNPDTYPIDRVPEKLVEESLYMVGKTMLIEVTPGCRYSYYLVWKILSWQPLKAYTPQFHRYFAEFLADTIVSEIKAYLAQAKCLWYAIEGDILKLYLG